MMFSRRYLEAAAVAAGLFAFPGCAVVVQRAVKSALKPVPAPQVQSASVNSAYVAGLTPLHPGRGLFVGEPATSGDPKLTSFGVGCARWLQLNAAGQAELGTTPTWGAGEIARRSLGYPDIVVKPVQVPDWANMTGVSDLAVGQLKASGSQLELSYQLMSANGKVEGSPLKVTGSFSQIIAGLPALARELDAALGVVHPAVPVAVRLASDDLIFFGGLPRNLDDKTPISAKDRARLVSLSKRDILGAVIYQRSTCPLRCPTWNALPSQMISLAPGNTIALSDCAYLDGSRSQSVSPAAEAMRKTHGNNFLLNLVSYCEAESSGDARGEVNAAETMVRVAPKTTLAWHSLGDALSDEADKIRQGRFSNEISAKEWKILSDSYNRAEAVALKATQLFPKYTYAWSDLSSAACFNNDMGQADSALWQALKVDPGNAEAYSWGLQMYQPKWNANNGNLLKLARMAAANANRMNMPATSVVEALTESGQGSQIKPILLAALKVDSRDGQTLYELANYYHYTEHNPSIAEPYYRQCLKEEPGFVDAYTGLGALEMQDKHNPKAAEPFLKQAVTLVPTDGSLHANLGMCFVDEGNIPAATVEAKLAKADGYTDPQNPLWGRTGVKP